MKCTLSLCLVVAVVFILGVGYAATKTPLMEAYTKGYYLYLSTPLTFSNSLLTMPRNQRLELESPHAGMVHLSRELDREVATFDKAREIMALIPAMRGG